LLEPYNRGSRGEERMKDQQDRGSTEGLEGRRGPVKRVTKEKFRGISSVSACRVLPKGKGPQKGRKVQDCSD